MYTYLLMPCTNIQEFLIYYCWKAGDILQALHIRCGCCHEVLMHVYMSKHQPISNISFLLVRLKLGDHTSTQLLFCHLQHILYTKIKLIIGSYKF